MRKAMTVLIALAVLAAGGAAWAAGTNTLTVQASVSGTCTFSTATSLINFGALDPANAVSHQVVITPTFWCTKGVVGDVIGANMGLNPIGGVRQLKDTAGTDLIPYSLTLAPDAGSNLGSGSPRTLTITGDIAAGSYTTVTASTYSDTVALTINP